MSELIIRADAENAYQTGYEEGFHAGYQQAMSELPEEQPRWISVDERLPKEIPFDCLVCREKDGYVNQATYLNMDKKHVWLADCKFWISDEVTHWMPLPKPYKTSTGEEK